MSILHFEYRPNLEFFHPRTRLSVAEIPFPTPNAQMNALVLPVLMQDQTDIRHLIIELEPIKFQYDPNTNLLHVWLQKKDKSQVTSQELANYLATAKPELGGRDTWMGGDISAIPEETAERFGYAAVELIPRINRVFVLDPNGQEHLVDTTQLPQPIDY